MANYTRFPVSRNNGDEVRREPVLFDEDLEAAFLGALLMASPEEVRAWTCFPDEIFSIERHGWIYAAIRELAGRGEPIHPVWLARILREKHGEGPWLSDLMALAEHPGALAPLLPEYARRLRELARRRRLARELQEIARSLHRPDAVRERLERLREIDSVEGEGEGVWTVAELLAAAEEGRIPQPDMLIPGLLPAAGLTLLVARPKAGKSLLALNAFLAIASGGVFLGRRIPGPRLALYLALEDGVAVVSDRLRTMTTPQFSGAGVVRFDLPYPLDTPEGQGWLRRMAAEMDLVVIDTIGAALSPHVDWNDYGAMGEIFRRLHRIAMDVNACLLAVHHTRKSLADGAVDAVLGTTGIAAAAAAIWRLRPDPEESGRAVLEISARSFWAEPIPIRLARDILTWQPAGELPTAAEEGVLELLAHAPEGLEADAVAEALGISRQGAHQLLASLERKGLVVRRIQRRNQRGRPVVLWTARPSQAPQDG